VATYSFLDNMASIVGPNGSVTIGAGAADTEGGITIGMAEDKNTMSIAADGAVMHSLHAGKSGTVTVRLQKTSPMNQQLSIMYAADTVGGGTHGKNTISVRDLARNDVVTCQDVAFAKFPDVTYAKDGGDMIWTFHAGKIDFVLGTGLAAA
jgi:hypothetical protein